MESKSRHPKGMLFEPQLSVTFIPDSGFTSRLKTPRKISASSSTWWTWARPTPSLPKVLPLWSSPPADPGGKGCPGDTSSTSSHLCTTKTLFSALHLCKYYVCEAQLKDFSGIFNLLIYLLISDNLWVIQFLLSMFMMKVPFNWKWNGCLVIRLKSCRNVSYTVVTNNAPYGKIAAIIAKVLISNCEEEKIRGLLVVVDAKKKLLTAWTMNTCKRC